MKMVSIYEVLLNIFYQARKTIFGLDPPINVDFSNAIDTELTKYIYPEQFKPHYKEDCEKRLRELTKAHFWQWREFREILVNLATIGERNYLPATNIPKYIFIDGIIPIINDLIKISNMHNKVEVSKSVFVDRERFCLIQSGKTRIGSNISVLLDLTPEIGRESYQIPIITIHLHPLLSGSYLFSYIDYISFLSEPKLIVMVVGNGNDIVLAMKTSATVNEVDIEGIKKHITMTKNDIESIWKRLSLPMHELALNKAICTEFGIILFKVIRTRNNLAKHLIVVDS